MRILYKVYTCTYRKICGVATEIITTIIKHEGIITEFFFYYLVFKQYDYSKAFIEAHMITHVLSLMLMNTN